jgi:hypothetical protein
MLFEELKVELEIEFRQLKAVTAEVNSLLSDTEGRAATPRETYAASALLSDFYGGVENVLKRFLKFYQMPFPTGENWHIALLAMFGQDSNPNLPLKIGEEQMRSLNEFRKVRHVVRNNYGHQLIWERLSPMLKKVTPVLKSFESSVENTLV